MVATLAACGTSTTAGQPRTTPGKPDNLGTQVLAILTAAATSVRPIQMNAIDGQAVGAAISTASSDAAAQLQNLVYPASVQPEANALVTTLKRLSLAEVYTPTCLPVCSPPFDGNISNDSASEHADSDTLLRALGQPTAPPIVIGS